MQSAEPPKPPSRLSLLAPMLPLLVFAVVDAFVTDPRVSVGAAIAFAAVQLTVTWARTKTVDRFVLLDTALVVLLGGVTIALEDDTFFKLKPAVMNVVGAVFVTGLLVAPPRVFVGYLARFSPGLELKDDELKLMRLSMALVVGFLVVHTVAVVVTAQHASRELWAFVSGPGFYLGVIPTALGPGLWARFRRQASDSR
jgi:intracellular septation protein A